MKRFDLKYNLTTVEFAERIENDLGFLFEPGSAMPDFKEPIIELYKHLSSIEHYYSCTEKAFFVEKYYANYSKQWLLWP